MRKLLMLCLVLDMKYDVGTPSNMQITEAVADILRVLASIFRLNSSL